MFKLGYEDIKDVDNPLDGKMPKIVEYFVKVYGEKYRDLINEKLNNAFYIFLDDGNAGGVYSSDIYFKERRAEKIQELSNYKKTYKGYTILNYDTFVKYLYKAKEWKNELKESDYAEFMEFARSVDISSLSKTKTSLSTRKLFGKQGNESELDINIENGKPKEVLKTILEFFEKESEDFDVASSEIEYIDSERKRLNIKSVGKNLSPKETIDALNKQDAILEKECIKEILEEYLRFLVYEYEIPLRKEMVPTILSILTNYQGFSSLADEDDVDEQRADDYINMFKEINEIAGKKIDLTGEDKKEIVLRHRKEMNDSLRDLLMIRADILLEKDIKNGTLPGRKYIEAIERTGSMDEYEIKMLLDERLGFHHSDERLGGACLCTMDLSTNKPFSVCFNSAMPNLADNAIVHEMGHIISATCRTDGEKYCFKVGLNMNTRRKDKNVGSCYTDRRFTALDEIINDYFTKQVVREMKTDGFAIGVKQAIPTIYSMAFPLMVDFLKKNKEKLIDAQLSDDPNRIYQNFDKEKIEALADACTIYFEQCCKHEELSMIVLDMAIKQNYSLMEPLMKAYPQEINEFLDAMNKMVSALKELEGDAKEIADEDNNQKE